MTLTSQLLDRAESTVSKGGIDEQLLLSRRRPIQRPIRWLMSRVRLLPIPGNSKPEGGIS
jgi:hypothetical protein